LVEGNKEKRRKIMRGRRLIPEVTWPAGGARVSTVALATILALVLGIAAMLATAPGEAVA
jgi:hypothetical protein